MNNLAFDEDPVNYDRWRPHYTNELYQDIFDYSNISNQSKALEIGIGTGQATEPFLKLGCSLTAVEIGESLSRHTQKKYESQKNITVVNTSFEEYRAPYSSYDLAYSATAFHWIPAEIGYPKVLNLLKEGGTFAVFWNRPWVARSDDVIHVNIQKIYSEYIHKEVPRTEYDYGMYETRRLKLISAGFSNVTFKLYHDVREFQADDYIGLLNTYSDHRSLDARTKEKFEYEIRNIINKYGGTLRIYDTIDLYLGCKS